MRRTYTPRPSGPRPGGPRRPAPRPAARSEFAPSTAPPQPVKPHENVVWCVECKRILREPEWPAHEHHPQLPAHPKGMRGAATIGEGRVDIKRVRYLSGLDGWDRCLGGGLVRGTRIYLTGEPGAGKSTLLLLALWLYAKSGLRVMYLSAEESRLEVEARYKNMELPVLQRITLYDTESWESAAAEIVRLRPHVIVLDSLNTFRTSSSPGEAGDDRQTMQIMRLSDRIVKTSRWEPSMLIVGQINKKGDPAGREAIIHHVTGHLHFSKDARGVRVLRTKKNRHGGDGEVSLFEFPPNRQRIREVQDISALLLADSLGRPGVIAYPTVPSEAIARPVVVPIECAVSMGERPKGSPKTRASLGLYEKALEDALDRMADVGVDVSSRSVRIQCPTVAGETVADHDAALAVCAAVTSAARGYRLPAAAAFGALAASNRVLPDPAAEARLDLLRRSNVSLVFGPPLGDVPVPAGMQYVAIADLSELPDAMQAVAYVVAHPEGVTTSGLVKVVSSAKNPTGAAREVDEKGVTAAQGNGQEVPPWE